MLALHVQDVVLDLEGQLMRVVMRTPASVGQPLNAAFLIAIEDLVARLASDAKLPAQFRGGSVTHVSGTMCYLCVEPLTCTDRRVNSWTSLKRRPDVIRRAAFTGSTKHPSTRSFSFARTIPHLAAKQEQL